ncbi:MAG: TonB-dependent receptor [Bacteroidota bacterium]
MFFLIFSRRLFFFLAVALLGMGLTYGAGTVTGRVTDKEGQPLAFANIVITHKIVNGQEVALKSQIGTVTDINGDYALTGIPDGNFKLEVLYLGYQNSTIIIEISGDETLRRDVSLENQTLDLEEVVITTQARGQIAAINQQLAAVAIKNVVAADRIRQNPDANAAEAIGRLPGISVTRSGGEATDIVIRGMSPEYNTVLLNGVEIPSNKGESRNAGLGGISQFSLQGVEVFKSITPDMDANTVSGAVNMMVGTAPSGLHGSLMAQGGFNAQNKDFGNYKFHGNISNRFLDDKLGIDLNLSGERTNRSTQLLTADYKVESYLAPEGEMEPMYLDYISLNNITDIKHRASGSIVIDYRFSPRSKIQLHSFFSSSPTDHLNINKSFVPQAGVVQYGLHQNSGGNSLLSTNALSGEHVLGIFHIDYGLSYSHSRKNDEIRNFGVVNMEGYQGVTVNHDFRSLPLSQVIDSAHTEKTAENLYNFGMPGPGSDVVDELRETQYDARLNIKVPFSTDLVSGNIKFGGQYKHKERFRDYDVRVYGGPPFHKLITGIQTTPDGIDWTIPWVTLNQNNHVEMTNMVGGEMGEFLQGGYNFGWYPDINKANEIYDWWQEITQYYFVQGRDVWMPIFGQERMIGYLDPRPSVVHDNEVSEDYYAGYIMGEFNIGKMIHFIPGARYEQIHDDLYGWFVERRMNEGLEIPGWDTTATRSNRYLLPMAHLKIKPLDWFHLQFSYTKTLHRPGFNAVIPFEYVNNALLPWEYEAGDPDLKPELWTNYDVMLAFHNSKIGLLSINGFYKQVEDKIWHRLWTRLPADPEIPHYDADDAVQVTSWYNHEHPNYVRGFEVEWQTNFWYLPKPFSYFTLTANYSYINNEATYPYMEVKLVEVGVDERGRPLLEKQRTDSTYTGPMLNQPKHLANISLGFSYKAFDIWVSYQYIGEITTEKAVQKEYDKYKGDFSRLGIQSRLELPVKGLEILFNLANLSDTRETHYRRGESRPHIIESYGWTADFGLRYVF